MPLSRNSVTDLLHRFHHQLEKLSQPTNTTPYIYLLFLTLALTLSVIQTWLTHSAFEADGLAYIDIATNVQAGNLQELINPYWSPLLPLIIAASFILFRPITPSDHIFTAHLANWFIFLFTLAAFTYLTKTIFNQPHSKSHQPLTRYALFAFFSTSFLLNSFSYNQLTIIKPDLLVAGFLYLAVAFLLRLLTTHPNSRLYLFLFGLTFGFAYLAKSPQFLLGLVAIFSLILFKQVSLKHSLFFLLPFTIVSLPYIFLISILHGSPTISTNAHLNYQWHVQGQPETFSQNLYSFNHSFSYLNLPHFPHVFDPLWLYPARYNQFLPLSFSFSQYLNVVFANLSWLHHRLEFLQPSLILLTFSILILALTKHLSFKPKPLLATVVPFFGLLMYLAIVVRERYTMIHFQLLLILILSQAKLKTRLGQTIITSLLLILSLAQLRASIQTTKGLAGHFHNTKPSIASKCQLHACIPSQSFATIGNYRLIDWPYLLHKQPQIIIPPVESSNFWQSSPETKDHFYQHLRSQQVFAVFSDQPPQNDYHTWQLISTASDQYMLKLTP